uniref:Uncharacterized protein n=1 Tax=Eptatretus burgeri TaxID=7764 RepID=A0A8C4NNH9_EPTBU
VTLTFRFLVSLGVLTVRVQTSCTPKHSSLSGGDLMTPSALLCSLYPEDSGDESPNPANRYQFNKLGLTSLADYIDDVGRPYLWAQWLGGIKFPPQCQVCQTGSVKLHFVKLPPLHLPPLQVPLLFRVFLTFFFTSVSKVEGGYVFTPFCLSVCLFVSLCARYLKKLWTDQDEILWAGSVLFFLNTLLFIFLFSPARMHIAVWLDCNYPKPPPILSLHLIWNGEHTAQNDINILAMEKEVNVFWPDLGCPGYEVLSLQLAHLAACLDVYLETSDFGPSHKGCTAFPRDKMFLRVGLSPYFSAPTNFFLSIKMDNEKK